MAASLKVLVPEATVNYIQNPSFRYDTTGWNAVGSVISRVLTYALFGIASLMVTTDGLVMREGVYYRVNDLAGISDPITISAYVRGDGMIHLRLIDSGGKEWVSPAIDTHPDIWQRLEISGFSTGSNDMRLYVETDGSAKAVTFYVDGCQMERKAYATTYCDGDQPGCRWNIMDSASNASRDANTRQGGRWVTLAGPCRENDDIYITVLGGLGMAPIQNNTQPWALAPGSYYQNTKVLDRVVTFNFNVKKEFLPIVRKVNLSPLHEMRQQLIDIFKPDLTGGSEPFLFSYQEEGGREMFINMRYEAGLEGDWDLRNQWAQSFPVRFLAEDPIMWEQNYHAQALQFSGTDVFNRIAQKVNGAWTSMNYGLNGDVYGMVRGIRGEIYVYGNFTVANNNVNAIDPMIPAKYIAKWDGTKFSILGSGANTLIHGAAVAANGDLYVVGRFTSIGGVAANYVAKYSYATGVWSALGTGFNDWAYQVAIAPNGDVYAVGIFTQAGGNEVNFVARWDGATWNPLGNPPGMDNEVDCIAIKKDGSIVYLGGTFTGQHAMVADDYSRVAAYDPATNTFSALGAGLNNQLKYIELSPSSQSLYAAGFFNWPTTGTNRISKFNGSSWDTMGSETDAPVFYMQVVDDNEIYVEYTPFTYIDDVYVNRSAMWNGSAFVPTDVKVPGTGFPMIFSLGGQQFVGVNNTNTNNLIHAASNHVINQGTAIVSPLIYIKGPGKLWQIENYTTHKKVYLNLTILDDEEVFIDFAHGSVWSILRGSLTYTVLPGSDFSDFVLIPGDNTINVFMTDDVDSSMYIYYRPSHWSADATIDAEPLY